MSLPVVRVWFVSAVAIVVVLTLGMTKALLDPSQEVDSLERAVYPPGAKIQVVGEATVAFTIGQRTLPPGWFAVGNYPWVATFPDGQVARSETPLTLLDKHPVTLVCDTATHRCTTQ